MSALLYSFCALGSLWGQNAPLPAGGPDEPHLPDGFFAVRVAGDLTGAVGMSIASDGRVFICEQTGTLRVVKRDVLLPLPFLSVKVDSLWERGLIGVALDPLFPERPYVYVNYIPPDPYPHHRISRFTAKGDVAEPGSEVVLLEGDDQTKLGGSVPAGHQGGAIRFGKDGKLYIGIGEQTAGAPAQRLDTFQGKILRINPDGSIPEDNPFYTKTVGKYRAIWALGLRNPFCIAVQPVTGRLFINDVGGSLFEEINEGEPGANYGWPEAEGPSTHPGFRNPIHFYSHGVGRCITGGAFYDPITSRFPSTYIGKYFFMDYEDHWIRTLDPDHPKTSTLFAMRFKRAVDLAVAPEGSLYVLDRNAWVKDQSFQSRTGSLWRIGFDPWKGSGSVGSSPPVAKKRIVKAALGLSMDPDRFPERLSELGLFRSLASLDPTEGLVPYEVNVPQWVDGATQRRWIALPSGSRIGFEPRGEWKPPAGAVLVEQLDRGRRLETRILIVDGDRSGFGAAYRWNADGTEALQVTEGENCETESEGKKSGWYSPGPMECLSCHSPPAGFVLGINSRQLNRVEGRERRNQILDWASRNMLDRTPSESELAGLSRIVSLSDPSAPLDLRVRSYLDANCAGCHRPGGAGRGFFDARIETPGADQHLIGGALMSGDLGIKEARTVVPGDVARSILYQRMGRRGDPLRMPPLGSLRSDGEALDLLSRWIVEQGGSNGH